MAPLDPETIKVVKSTAPVLEVHGTTITKIFYGIMFEEFPQVKEYFNTTNQFKASDDVPAQPRALADAVYAYAANIDNLGALGPAVTRIAHKHASLGIMPEHYPIVGTCLLKAIKQVLGDAATPEIMDAWTKAYFFLADIFIDAENKIREENEKKVGGWSGFKPFVVAEKTAESDEVYSFKLKPLGGGPVASFLPGQYLSFRLELADGEIIRRNYSISDAAEVEGASGGEYYRVSIKRVEGGRASNYFHDNVHVDSVIEVGPPCGDFFVDNSFLVADKISSTRPLVLISAGIGCTPVLAMLKTVLKVRPHQPIYYLHGAKDGARHPFTKEVKAITQAHPTCHSYICYSQPREGVDIKGDHYDAVGRVDANTLYKALGGAKPADLTYYFCGPAEFMKNLRALLRWLSVPDSEVHFEAFGPLDSKIDAATPGAN